MDSEMVPAPKPDAKDVVKPAPDTREQALILRDKALKLLEEVLADVPVVVAANAHFGGLRSALAGSLGVIRLSVEELE